MGNCHDWAQAQDNGALRPCHDKLHAGSTPSAMRDALTSACDRLILLDDVCLSTNRTKRRERRDLATQLIRYAANGTPLIDASERALQKVWQNIQSELRRIENRPPTLAEAISSGIRSKRLPAFGHAGCVCVRTDDLVAYLLQVYQRSDLIAHFVTSALRRLHLLSLDNTGKSTKKIAGRRYLCFPYSNLC